MESQSSARVKCIVDVRHKYDAKLCEDQLYFNSLDPETRYWYEILRSLQREWDAEGACQTSSPIVQPSDTVAILAPLSSSTSDRILFVHRFATVLNEQAIFLVRVERKSIDPVISLRCDNPQTLSDFALETAQWTENRFIVDYVKCTARAPENEAQALRAKTPDSTPILSSLGKDELYVVYKFVRYLDKFHIHTGSGASLEGINLYTRVVPIRKDPSSARFITVLPPGSNALQAMRNFVNDLVHGMTKGSKIIDAAGNQRTIFLDCVGMLGDTPGINGMLDVLGHSHQACCHLCSYFSKSDSPLINGYVRRDGTSARTYARRTIWRQNAVRSMNVPDEISTILGVEINPSQLQLVLHHWQSELIRIRSKIPRTDANVPVLSSYFDPFSGSFVSPDHLMCGHATDLLRRAFVSLTEEDRKSFEKSLLGFVRDCGHPVQNRIYKHASRSLYSMGICQIYAIIPLMADAYEMTVNAHTENKYSNNRYKLIKETLRS